MDLDQLQRGFALRLRRRMHGLHERTLAGAARTPEQRIVGGQAAREAARVFEQRVALAVDAFEQRQWNARDLSDGLETLVGRGPDESVTRLPIDRGRRGGGEALKRRGD